MVRTKDRVTLDVMPGAPESSRDIADVLKCIVDCSSSSSNNPTIQPLAERQVNGSLQQVAFGQPPGLQ
jgi:hypothetical protein